MMFNRPEENADAKNQVPLADGTCKNRVDVTNDDIIALAKADTYGIAEYVTDSDLAVLRSAIEIYSAEAEMWRIRSDAAQELIQRGTNGMNRLDSLLKFVDASFAVEMFELLKSRNLSLVNAFKSFQNLKLMQSQSSDLVDLYRRFIADTDM